MSLATLRDTAPMSTEQVFADQSTYLSILTAADGAAVKDFVEPLLARLSAVEVLASRTGLAMLPFTDSVKGITFYLGETLLAEAHVRVGAQEGYAACLGRDLEQAIALALLDAILQSNEAAVVAEQPAILAFVAAAAQQQTEEEAALLRKVAATRVELETF